VLHIPDIVAGPSVEAKVDCCLRQYVIIVLALAEIRINH
jgi:hypothetical protein